MSEAKAAAAPDGAAYDKDGIPFADVMRKLANTKPPHKVAKPTPPKPPKR